MRLGPQEVGGLIFDADFDSGNCARVEQRGESEFALWTCADCEGTAFQTGFRTWFHFSVRGAVRGRTLHFAVYNMNPQGKLFKFDMRPVWRSLPSQPAWERVRSPTTPSGTKEEDNFVIRFRHKPDTPPEDTLFFAFCYPQSYGDCMARLQHLDAIFGLPPASAWLLPAGGEAGDGGDGGGGGGSPPPGHEASVATEGVGEGEGTADQLCAIAALGAAADGLPSRRPPSVYYHRELLTRSLEGRRLDLITITAAADQLDEREPPLPEGLLPEGGERPHRFARRPVFFVSARVHPGEVPASHVFDGVLAFLLREHDPRARRLRERFVFKLVPMLNPDGVARGHYRSDTRGVNLNRVYLDPSAARHPTVHAAHEVVRQHLSHGELMWYIDLHGHATKRGCFLYGNALPSFEQQVENVMYARLVALNSRWFDFAGSVFSLRNMYGKDKRDGLSKEGSGRVGTFKLSGEQLIYCYTLECNYNMGKVVNSLPEKAADAKGLSRDEQAALSPPASPQRGPPPKYTPDSWRDVGKALVLAALDVIHANPASRLGTADKREASLQRMRGCVSAMVRTQARKQAARAAKRSSGSDDEDDTEADDDEEEEEEEEEEGEEDAHGRAPPPPQQRQTPPPVATGGGLPQFAPPPQASTAPRPSQQPPPPSQQRERAGAPRTADGPSKPQKAPTPRSCAAAAAAAAAATGSSTTTKPTARPGGGVGARSCADRMGSMRLGPGAGAAGAPRAASPRGRTEPNSLSAARLPVRRRGPVGTAARA